MVKVHSFPSQIFVLNEAHNVTPIVEERVQAIWIEKSREFNLYDGEMFSLESISENQIKGRFRYYRYFVAQLHSPDLFPDLRIQPLAILGMIFCNEGIIFGRRRRKAIQSPGCWELLPSGGLSRLSQLYGGINANKQVLQEFNEELGMNEKEVEKMTSLFMIEDIGARVFDLCFRLQIPQSFSFIMEAFKSVKCPEHDELRLVELCNIPRFLKEPNISLVDRTLINQVF